VTAAEHLNDPLTSVLGGEPVARIRRHHLSPAKEVEVPHA
jgi:hypothetical protein